MIFIHFSIFILLLLRLNTTKIEGKVECEQRKMAKKCFTESHIKNLFPCHSMRVFGRNSMERYNFQFSFEFSGEEYVYMLQMVKILYN